MSIPQLAEPPIVSVDLFCGGGGLSTALARAITNVALTRVESDRDVYPDDEGELSTGVPWTIDGTSIPLTSYSLGDWRGSYTPNGPKYGRLFQISRCVFCPTHPTTFTLYRSFLPLNHPFSHRLHRMSQLPERMFEVVEPGDNLLLLSPPFTTAGPNACVDLLTPEGSAQENVLAVTYTKSPGDLLARWDQYSESFSEEAAIINVETETRSTASVTRDGALLEQRDSVSIEPVSSASDLTGLGIAITNQLEEWHAETPAQQTVACVHSVTSLLQYVDLKQSFKFLDVVTSKFTDVDAIAHFHMDPAAHDDQTIYQLLPLFDVVCEYEDQEWALPTAY